MPSAVTWEMPGRGSVTPVQGYRGFPYPDHMPGRAGTLLCKLPLEMDLPAAEIHLPCRAGILQGWYLAAGC